MAEIGNQTSAYKAPQYPSKKGPKASNTAIRRSSPKQAQQLQKANEKGTQQQVEKQEFTQEVLQRRADTQKIHHDVKKQRSAQSDTFESSTELAKSRDQNISKFAGEVADKKEQQAKQQKYAQNLEKAKLGEGQVKAQSSTDVEDLQNQNLAASVSQANTESLDPDARLKKQADKMLDRIFKEGGDKGKAFVAFAKREISKGRFAEVQDLIEGYHGTLRRGSLTASEMVDAGEEPLITLKHMISPENTDEVTALMDKIALRPDASAGFKRDMMAVRNKSTIAPSTKVRPPSFNKSSKPSQIESAISFISSINIGSIKAPWDLVAA